MEILKILENSGKNLYPEDLDFFETELATGEGYDGEYQVKCREKIRELRSWLNTDDSENCPGNTKHKGDVVDSVSVKLEDLAPKGMNSAADLLNSKQIIFQNIASMRQAGSYKTAFKKYIAEKSEIDAAFVDANYSFFQPWELDAIISVKQMGEEFLEKYFGALDKSKIARYQLFSENFFIKHFSQMDSKIVLENGKNEWRKKENRSKQLSVFLRLKGVKI